MMIQNVRLFINGYEWGPAVAKLIVELDQEVSEVLVEGARVMTAGTPREIEQAFVSDAKGNPVSGASHFVTLDLSVSYDLEQHADVASPFGYDAASTHYTWVGRYEVMVADLGLVLASDGSSETTSITLDAIEQRLAPEVDLFSVRDSFGGEYQNPLTRKMTSLNLTYAAYEPPYVSESEISPLIVWLHGQGEGGTDIEVALLGNEVTALTRPEIQSQFKTGSRTGAHVLVVQTPTYWMDEGDGTNGPGAGKSIFTEILMDTIQQYVDKHDRVDGSRIYLGGASNGGYMTLNMILNYPDIFAAAFPVCPAYSFYGFERTKDGNYRTMTDKYGRRRYVSSSERCLSDDILKRIVDMPLWFVHAATDHVVVPFLTSEPTYRRLLRLGAENAWFSYFETVRGHDVADEKYSGHASWMYLFNNEVISVQNAEAVKTTGEYKPSDKLKGGKYKATDGVVEYANIFEWMNNQRR